MESLAGTSQPDEEPVPHILSVVSDGSPQRRLSDLLVEIDGRESLERTLAVIADELLAVELGSAESQVSTVLGLLGSYVCCDSFVAMRFIDEAVEHIEIWSEGEEGRWISDSGNAVRLRLDMLPAIQESFRRGEAHLIPDAETLSESCPERWFMWSMGSRSAAAVPIYSMGRLRGALIAMMQSEPREWDARDVSLVDSVARYITQTHLKKSAIRDLNRSRIMFEHLAATSDNGVWLADPLGRTILMNGKAANLLGTTEAASVGMSVEDFVCFTPQSVDQLHDAMLQGRQTSLHITLEAAGTNRWVDITILPLSDEGGAFDASLCLLIDVTEKILHQQREREMARMDRLMGEVMRCIDRAKLPKLFARDICRAIVESGGFLKVWIGLHEARGGAIEPYESFGGQSGYMQTVLGRIRKDREVRQRLFSALTLREPLVFNDTKNAQFDAVCLASEFGIGSIALFPLTLRSGVLGFLAVCAQSENAFSETVVDALSTLAIDFTLVHDGLSNRIRRQEAEAAHHEVSQLLEAIVESVPVGILSIDVEGCVSSLNRFGEKAAGVEARQLIGRRLPTLFSALSEQPACAFATQVLAGTEISGLEAPISFKSGKRIVARIFASPLHSSSGKVTGAVVLFADITSQRRLAKRTQRQQRRLREMTAEMGIALDRERRQIALGLHDTVGQNLAALSLALGMLGPLLEQAGEKPKHARAMRLLADTIRETRSFTFEISPPILDELGLGAALEWLVERYASEWPGEWTYRGEDVQLDREHAALLYRSARELLGNAARHAQAEHIEVVLERDQKEIRLTVSDDGCGFVDGENSGKYSLGLFGMREQLARLGSHLEIRSKQPGGTRAVVRLPLDQHHTKAGGRRNR